MSADRVDVIGNLRMALQHVVLCVPDELVQKSIEESIDVVDELIEAGRKSKQAIQLALPHMAHLYGCSHVRPTSEWAEHGSLNFDSCQCDIPNVRAALDDLESALSRIAQPGDGDGNSSR